MSNRKKLKDQRFAGKLKDSWKPGRDRRRKALQRVLEGSLGPEIDQYGLAKTVTAPEDEVEVIKEVPAVVTHPETNEKVTVGTAYIHSDRSVAIKYDEDAPEWALKYIKHTADMVGYNLETGGPTDG